MRRILVFLVLLVLAAPTVAASWNAAGSREPDTSWDKNGGRMFQAPDTTPTNANPPVRKVYFNAFQALPQTSQNPNVAALGTHILPAPSAHHRALLGVWKDCNKDGYVGHAESALQDYRVELLTDTSVCKPVRVSALPVHNDDQWVSELLGIGMVDPCEFAPDDVRAGCGVDDFARNERVYYDNATYVWGDTGAPGSIPRAECVLAPLPPGTTTGSGALIGYADCQSRRGVAKTVNDIDDDGSLRLRFEDPQRPESSSSLLNQRFPVTPYGRPGQTGLLEEGTSERAFTAWDCSSPKGGADVRSPVGPIEIPVEDPSGDKLSADTFPWVIPYSLTGVGFRDEDGDPRTPGVLRVRLTDPEGSVLWAPRPAVAFRSATASWWAAAAHAADGPNGDCDPQTPSEVDAAHPELESDQTPILEARKDRASFTFKFYDGHRGLNPHLDPTTGPTTPSDGGTMALDHGRGGDGPMWSALVESEQDPPALDRATLRPAAPLFFTYYARVSGTATTTFGLTLPNPQPNVYGSDNCQGATSGIVNGWVCASALWWKDGAGNDVRPRYARGEPIGRVPGDLYDLRDVDCYDAATPCPGV